MKVFVLLIIICVLHESAAQNGNCNLDGVDEGDWTTFYRNSPKDDTERNEFKRFSATNVTGSLSVTGKDARYFSAVLQGGEVIISPTSAFEYYEENEDSIDNPQLVSAINLPCNTGSRILNFYQPIRDINNHEPFFSKKVYTYNLPMPFPQNIDISLFGDKITATDIDIGNTAVDFSIEPQGDFIITYGGAMDNTNKHHLAIIKAIRPLKLTTTTSYTITVTDRGTVPGKRSSTAILTIVVDEEASLPSPPKFSAIYYMGKYIRNKDKDTVDINHISIVNASNDEVFELKGDHKSNFVFTASNGQVTISLQKDLQDDILKNNAVIILSLKATVKNSDEGHAVIVIKLPERECQEISTTTDSTTVTISKPTTEIPTSTVSTFTTTSAVVSSTARPSVSTTDCTCPATVTPAPQDGIQFTKENYLFKWSSALGTGAIGSLKASVTPKEDIIYSLKKENGEVPKEIFLDPNSGVLTATGYLTNSIYDLIAVATGVNSGIQATASVIIYLGTVTLTYSVIVKHVQEEEMVYDIIKYNGADGYEYQISDVYAEIPGKDKLFEINTTTGSLQTAIKLDREWDEIAYMYSSQFSLKLSLKGKGKSRTRRSVNDVNKEWLNIDDKIITGGDDTLVVIKVDDINDNSPIFNEGEKLVVGYPIKDLDLKINPPYLTAVKATDKDTGINAVIRYFTDSDKFTIHPTSGIVYPSGDIYEENTDILSFVVTAIDRNGSTDGNKGSLNIEVMLLDQEHITILMVEDNLLENVEVVLSKLNEKTGYNFKYLTASVVPRHSCISRKKRSTRSTAGQYLRIVAYVLDSQDKLVTNKNINTTIDLDYAALTVESWSAGDTATNSLSYVLTIIILATLLVVVVLLFAAFYFLKVRKIEPNIIIGQNGSANGTSHEFLRNTEKQIAIKHGGDISKRRPTGYIFATNNNIAGNLDFEEDTNTQIYSEITNNDESNNDKLIENARERKKSVTFNSNVEKFNIEVEDEKL